VLTRTTNRIRPTLEALETREVYWVGLPGLPIGTLSPIVHLGPVAPSGPAVTAEPSIKPASQLHVADSVITLRNATSHAHHFTVLWEGSTTAQTYTLLPGQARRIWVREVERFPVSRAATIRLNVGSDKAAPLVFHVSAALSGAGPGGPIGQGAV
jgi:hypothetical protein